LRLVLRAERLARRMAAATEPTEWWRLFDEFSEFRPIQQPAEFVRLLTLVRSCDAVRLCEIGTASGGMLCSLARAARRDATLVAVDCEYSPERKAAFPRFRRDRQRIVCIEGSSQSPATHTQVRQTIGGDLDVLLIDGDHSYEGVRRDFDLYTPLVRPGGLIILHDIVQDRGQRFGEATTASTGGVPRFWNEVKSRHDATEEIVDDIDQDGYGVGLLRKATCNG
jgi:predicted O-methyltransferase YrrM